MTESILSDCPDCGAKRHYEERYKCGSFINKHFGRSSDCYEAEIAKLKTERDLTRKAILAVLEELKKVPKCEGS